MGWLVVLGWGPPGWSDKARHSPCLTCALTFLPEQASAVEKLGYLLERVTAAAAYTPAEQTPPAAEIGSSAIKPNTVEESKGNQAQPHFSLPRLFITLLIPLRRPRPRQWRDNYKPHCTGSGDTTDSPPSTSSGDTTSCRARGGGANDKNQGAWFAPSGMQA